jgi:penicillin-binding protein 1C
MSMTEATSVGSESRSAHASRFTSHASRLLARLTCFLLLFPAVCLALPSYDRVERDYLSTEAVLLDRRGDPIQELRVDQRGRRLPWVRLSEVSPAFIRIVLRAEDKRFYAHRGVDWLALSDAALDNLFSSKPRGASTLSMQVAAMLERELKARKQHRTLGQKWEQMRAARELESAWTKRQILEAYLNLSTFRGEIQGVGAAARALFGKHPSGLDDRESLVLAVLLRGPNATPQVVAKRACSLAKSMEPPLPCAELDALAATALNGGPNLRPAVALAPHVGRALLSAQARSVQSTLDGELQVFVLEAMNRQLATLSRQHVADAAVLVVDNAGGEVLAYAGNQGESSSARYVDGVRAARQAGSALKPFLYELAIEQRLLTAASLLDDSPVNLVTPSGLYVPQDYDRDFKGLVSLRTALSSSLNVPAVRTLMLVGVEAFVERLRELGFEGITHDADYYGYALALGSAEVSLWQLTNAYRALANGGVLSPLRLTQGAKLGARRAMSRPAAYVVADVLSDRAARSVTFGLSNPLAARTWAAVKTGTSKDMRDNWCVGFSSRYTVGVWVGNFDGSPMWDVSGVTGAAPLWLEIMERLHAGGSGAPVAPPGLETATVRFEPPVEAPREELFVEGTAETTIAAKPEEKTHPAIVYPERGQIIALDPDIPDALQRVPFEAIGAGAQSQWRLNGEAVSASGSWRPQPGTWHLTLHDANGDELDSVQFEVRGNVAAPAAQR